MKLLNTISLLFFVLAFLQQTNTLNVDITAGPDQTVSSVSVSGSDTHAITESEITAFNLGEDNINTSLEASEGKAPDDYAFADPTNNGDQYKENEANPVQTTLTAVSAEIIGFESKPMILATKDFTNSLSTDADFEGDLSQEVSNTAESSWSETSGVSVSQSIEYGISFLGTGATGTTSFDYSSEFGKGGSQSQTITAGTSSGFKTTVPAGKSVRAELSSTQGTMTVRVTYEATLSGEIYYHYNEAHNDHFFWFWDIYSISDVPEKVTITEDITLNFFSNSQITVKDLENPEEVLASEAATMTDTTGKSNFPTGSKRRCRKINRLLR